MFKMTVASAKAELDQLAPKIRAAQDADTHAAAAVLDGDNPRAREATKHNLGALLDRQNLLVTALPKMEQREAEEAEGARTAEEQRQAAARKAANEALARGAKVDCDTIRREAKPISDACDTLARALAGMRKPALDFNRKFPDCELPDDDFGTIDLSWFTKLIAGELTRAAHTYGVADCLPGVGDKIPDEPVDKILKRQLDGHARFARRVMVDGERYEEPAPPRFRRTNIWLDRYQPAGYHIVRGDPAGGPIWRKDPGSQTGTRPPTAAERESDMRDGPELDRYPVEASGTPGVVVPGRFNVYRNDRGDVVARYLENSPVVPPLDNADRDAEAAWVAAGQPPLQPGMPGYVAAETGPMYEPADEPAVEQHKLTPVDPAPETIVVDPERQAAEEWLASRNGGKPAPLEPPETPAATAPSDTVEY